MSLNLKIFLVLFFSTFSLRAETLGYSLSTEFQDFYLNPKNSAPLFAKYEFKTVGSFEVNSNLSLKTNVAVNYVQLTKQDDQKYVINPTDFGMLLSTSWVDLNLGFWTLSPEGTDINNIFEVIHGKDYRQPLASENLGSLGALIDFHFSNADFKLFYIPKNRKSLLPDTQSPWWPRTEALPVTNSSGTFLLPDNISYDYRNDSELNHPFDNNFGALGKWTAGPIDFYGFYFSGANQIPQVSPHFNIDVTSITPLVGVVRPPVDLDLTWIKSEHLGGGITTAFDNLILKTFCKSEKDFYADPIFSTACTFAAESNLNMSRYSLHYFLQANRLWKNNSNSELQTLLGFFEKSSAVGFLIDLNPENSLSGAVVYNEKSPAYLISLRYEKKWTDSLRTNFSWNQITATDDPVGKAYGQTNNLGLKLTYNF